ncbi:hypothetical protein C3B61_15375 [Cryobacterium zongtaii]|uniref:XdhC Rossmann domain-containing protein n=1 Tax=Cryobacterium zongtaii TaxID=1259217 RepID=A0A2S3Z9N6_9MICO|nr:hypothetical protein [Cryobacterium zongtaii]POH62266.1 hypothetical protein C3B61_15375 [Cryobacterium zongtaii]
MPDAQPARTEWSQRAVRVFASQTNLLVASSRVLVVGAGPLAAELAFSLGIMGARVAVTSTDAAALPSFASHGHDTYPARTDGVRIPAETDLVFATGEEQAPLRPGAIDVGDLDEGPPPHPLVIVDAAPAGETAAVDLAAFAAHPAVPARDRIRGFALTRDVFVLTISAVAVDRVVDSALSAVRS